jgi:hypothetical protein
METKKKQFEHQVLFMILNSKPLLKNLRIRKFIGSVINWSQNNGEPNFANLTLQIK